MAKIDRRGFVAGALGTLGALSLAGRVRSAEAEVGFFRMAKRDGRWWFLDGRGQRFFSIGLNHIDGASLRYAESGDVWRDEFDNSMEKWLGAVGEDLQQWGFNSIGWVQEVVTREPTNHRHSPNFTFEEYQWLGMPYCHMLDFSDIHQWEVETRNPDVRSKGFRDWCDYVARSQCARLADDPKLIGYFYSDCPTWVHVRKDNAWKGPMFDPKRLESEAGRRELFEMASCYYKVTYEAVRRYDKRHLILGDRYEAKAPLPDEVVRAAMPYVDVLSFQCFGGADVVKEKLGYWAEHFDKPVLLADNSNRRPNDPNAGVHHNKGQDPTAYAEIMKTLRKMDACVGYHLCGAYICNRVRRCGLRDERNQVDSIGVDGIRKANLETQRWMRTAR